MAMTPSEALRDFHTKFGVAKAHPHDGKSVGLRLNLIAEEAKEVVAAGGFCLDVDWQEQIQLFSEGHCEPAHLLKELADLVYVCYGAAEAFGWDLDEAFKRVHESNMSKLGADGKPIYREDGKVLKGPNYREPYLGDLV